MRDRFDNRGSAEQWLIRAKLEAPGSESLLVKRPQLIERLDACLGLRLCLVVAPAGFGKTSLLVQWRTHLQSAGVQVAWLSLDEADADRLQFLSYLVLSLASAGIDLGRLEPMAEQGLIDSDLRLVLTGILDALAAQPQPLVLILDDYHRLQAPEVDALLATLIAGLPPHVTIVLNSRTRPAAMNLSAMIAAGQAQEITAGALRFSPEEVRQAVRLPLSHEELEALYARTEGWPVAVQLAKLLLGETRDDRPAVERLSGERGHIAAYLTEQVLATLPADVQDFLIRTSILERFNAPLANALTGRRDALDTLRRLEPLNALVVQLPERHEWYRYHHLFAECLRDHLQRRHPDHIEALHQHAADWFAAQGQVAEAVQHARAAGDFARCAALIEQAGGWELILFGGIGYLRNLLRNIPEAELYGYPRLLVAKAYLAIKDGHLRDARAYFDAAAAQATGPETAPGLARDLLNVGSLLDVYEDQALTIEQYGRVEAALARVSPADPVTIGILACQKVLWAIALGRLGDAEAGVQDAMRAMRQGRTVLGLNYCFLHAGLVAFYQGRFQVADAHVSVARRMAEENFGSDSGLRFLAEFLDGMLRQWQGRLGDAERHRFLAAAEHVETYDGWYEIYANGLDIEADFRVDTALSRADRLVAARGIDRLRLQADAQRLRSLSSGRGGAEVERLLHRLDQALPDQVWRRAPFLWRPFIESRLSMAMALGLRDRARALRLIDDALDCCAMVGAGIFRIELLLVRAHVLDLAGDRTQALADLLAALHLAAPERVRRPFDRQRGVAPLLRVVLKKAREEHVDVLVLDFVTSLLSRAPVSGEDPGGHFSPREQEVLEELAAGLANKEIARVLDMTEHTVKFHLKNIFAKLQVESRTQAIARARSLKLF